jgi:hypothetical protein
MTTIVAACVLAAAALIAAPHAAADPQDLVPYCSGDQTPMDDNCRPMAHQIFTHADAPGADPDVPLGTDPDVPLGTNPDVPLGTDPGEQPVVGG